MQWDEKLILMGKMPDCLGKTPRDMGGTDCSKTQEEEGREENSRVEL
jgi:hypothetical protein